MIQVLQTYGSDMKWNPHLHCIVTEGGFDNNWNWIHFGFIPYRKWRRKWQYKLLTLLKKELPKGTETNVFIDRLFKDYPNGFVVNGKRRFEKREGWSMARYIGRYIKHPSIAESRIIAYDGKHVTFWYRDSETDQKITVTMDKFEFVGLLLSHIPEKNFKIVRYIGIYSRRGYRHTQTEFHEAVIVIIKRSWREEIKKTFEYDPLICPYCNTQMELIGICYEGTESYPIDNQQPVKPPPNIKLSQQERMQLIVSLIIENQNGRGASIEKVVSEAVKRGVDEEQVLCSIQHLKDHGEAYETKKGEIRYAF
jgi:Putative transposase